MKKFVLTLIVMAIAITTSAQVEAKLHNQKKLVYFLDTDQDFVLDTVTEDPKMYEQARKVGLYATSHFVQGGVNGSTSFEYKGTSYRMNGLKIAEAK